MFGFNMFPMIPRTFVCDYACFSIAMLPGNEREDVERGGKIIMPPSALEQLTRLNINYPMLFKLTNRLMDRVTHSGVLEFVADEGKVYLPHWMMRNLMLNEGESVIIENVSMPVATYSKFQPQSPEFLDISNPKAVLENCLRNFACLTTGDTINIKYNSKDYELFVIETQPGKAVTIIECDMNVEFASPVGYQEPNAEDKSQDEMEMEDPPVECSKGFMAFTGIGHRLDGKGRKPDFVTNGVFGGPRRGIPDYDYDYMSLTFLRNVRPLKKPVVVVPEFKPFEGDGNILNPKKLDTSQSVSETPAISNGGGSEPQKKETSKSVTENSADSKHDETEPPQKDNIQSPREPTATSKSSGSKPQKKEKTDKNQSELPASSNSSGSKPPKKDKNQSEQPASSKRSGSKTQKKEKETSQATREPRSTSRRSGSKPQKKETSPPARESRSKSKRSGSKPQIKETSPSMREPQSTSKSSGSKPQKKDRSPSTKGARSTSRSSGSETQKKDTSQSGRGNPSTSTAVSKRDGCPRPQKKARMSRNTNLRSSK